MFLYTFCAINGAQKENSKQILFIISAKCVFDNNIFDNYHNIFYFNNKNVSLDGLKIETIVILVELSFLNIQILFTFYIYTKNNGMVNNIKKKFGTFGQFKQLGMIILDVETIILQVYLIVIFYIGSDRSKMIQLFSSVIFTLILNVTFTIYVAFYQIKQVFQIFGIGNMRFWYYSPILQFNLVFLFYTFLMGFIRYMETYFDQLFIFYLYSSLRLFNLQHKHQNEEFQKQFEKQKQDENKLDQQLVINSLLNQKYECQLCNQEFTLIDKIIYYTACPHMFHKLCLQNYRVQHFEQENNLECIYQQQLLSLSIQVNYICQTQLKQEIEIIAQVTQKQLLLAQIILFLILTGFYIIGNIIVFNTYFLIEEFRFYSWFNIVHSALLLFYILTNSSYFLTKLVGSKTLIKLRQYYLAILNISQIYGLYWLVFDAKYYQVMDKEIAYNILKYIIICFTQALYLNEFVLLANPNQRFQDAFTLNFFRSQMSHQVSFYIILIFISIKLRFPFMLVQLIPFLYFGIYVMYWDIHQIRNPKNIQDLLPYYYNFHKISTQICLIISSIQYFIYAFFEFTFYTKNNLFLILKYFILGCVIITYQNLEQDNQSSLSQELYSTIFKDIHKKQLSKCFHCFEQINQTRIYFIQECEHSFHQDCFKKYNKDSLVLKCPYCYKNQEFQQIKQPIIKLILQGS
ncbi:hypothetical protein pb186bvf_011028 [Paramecium bursaria]